MKTAGAPTTICSFEVPNIVRVVFLLLFISVALIMGCTDRNVANHDSRVFMVEEERERKYNTEGFKSMFGLWMGELNGDEPLEYANYVGTESAKHPLIPNILTVVLLGPWDQCINKTRPKDDRREQLCDNIDSFSRMTGIPVKIYDSTACLKIIDVLEIEGLREVYLSPGRLAHRSDICRMAALWKHGGWYMDADQLSVQPFQQYMRKDTEFITVMNGAWPEENSTPKYMSRVAQSFIGTVKNNPVIKKSVEIMVGVKQGTRDDCVFDGPCCLALALMKLYPDEMRAIQDNGLMYENNGLQFIQEVFVDYSLPREQLDPRLKWIPKPDAIAKCGMPICNYAMIEPHSGEIIFFSRMFD